MNQGIRVAKGRRLEAKRTETRSKRRSEESLAILKKEEMKKERDIYLKTISQ